MTRSGSAKTLRAGQDAPTIQGTISLSVSGDVVEVPSGTWREHVIVDRAIVLRGKGGIVDGGGKGTVVTITSPDAIVEHLTIQGSGSNLLGRPDCGVYVEPDASNAIVQNNTILDSTFGVWIHRTNGAYVLGNHVVGRHELRPTDRGNGIQLFDGTNLTVRKNHVEQARDGIYVSAVEDSLIEDNFLEKQRYGIHYMFSHRNIVRQNRSINNLSGFALMESDHLTVSENVAEDNERHGILFRDAQYCTIADNLVRNNEQGLFFFSSTDNVIRNNRIMHNDMGAKIWAGSLRNEVSGNSFIGNGQQIFYVGAEDLIFGENSPGNYFSDYIGWDQNRDGLGDRPYRMNSFGSTLIYQYPQASLLMHSPTMELLAHLEESFPLLQVPTIVDKKPKMTAEAL